MRRRQEYKNRRTEIIVKEESKLLNEFDSRVMNQASVNLCMPASRRLGCPTDSDSKVKDLEWIGPPP